MERGIKLPQSSSEWGFKGENYLLIIGIDKYQHWKPLNNAVKDVRDIALLLTERYQFEPNYVITLIDEQATEDSIRKHLLDIKRSITKEDNLVVFFSGHGYYDQDLDEGYWVPANARKDSPSDYISNSDVLKWIRAIKTHHTLVVVDSCFSGSLVSQSRSEVLSEKYPSSRIFASGRKELVDDGAPGTNSPFAKAILGRLTYNTDRVMRASELIQNVTKSVESYGGQAPIEGRIKEAGDEGGEFVFHLKVTEEEIWNAVVAANTPAEYSKYLEYFPDGNHALTARTKLSELTDEEDWKKALELSTAQAYTKYLEAHPRGCCNEEALRRLEELEEDDAWQKAKTRNAVSSYMDYLRKYPDGKFDSLARKNLDSLKRDLKQNEQDLVSDELQGIGDTTVRTKDNKELYKTLINEGEGFFSQMQYEKSIAKYDQALHLSEAHFVPNKNFVIQRIDLARKRIKYSEFLSDGDDALKSKNFDLAIEYYKKAQSYDDTIQIRNNIEHAKRRGLILQPPPMPVIQKQKRSKRSPVFWIVGVILLIVLGIVGYVASEFSSDSNNYSSDYNSYNQESTTTADPVPAYDEPASNTNMGNISDMIIGSWYVADRVINNVSAASSGNLVPANWDFYYDGSVGYTTDIVSDNGMWNIDQYSLSVSLNSIGNIPGHISSIDGNSMTWVTTEVLLGYQYTVTNYLNRRN